ncbi:Ig-like domain-containing protein [Paenibacillus glycinis]|nr:Ig-like domain-containing protein [Paenibacillus glycinis]
MDIVAYDASGNIVKQWEQPGARYLWQITIDAAARTITFWGQASQRITMGWGEFLRPAATAAFTTADLEIGEHAIHAVYAGDDGYSGSETPVVTHTVNRIPTYTEFSSSQNPSLRGEPVDLMQPCLLWPRRSILREQWISSTGMIS